MDSQKIIQLKPETFLLLVKQLRHFEKDADVFEINLDSMRVKGDLRAIKNNFPNKQFIGVSISLDLLKAAAIAGWEVLRIPKDLELDAEFLSLIKNRETKLLQSES